MRAGFIEHNEFIFLFYPAYVDGIAGFFLLKGMRFLCEIKSQKKVNAIILHSPKEQLEDINKYNNEGEALAT